MPTTTPLTDAINALTTYANETTGASDTTLSDAVATLVAGYGQGGGSSSGLFLLKTINVTGERGKRIDIESSWFDSYPYVFIIPNVVPSVSDWMDLAIDSYQTTYWTNGKANSFAEFATVLKKGTNGFCGAWFRGTSGAQTADMLNIYGLDEYLYYFCDTASVTMTGDYKVYGVDFTRAGEHKWTTEDMLYGRIGGDIYYDGTLLPKNVSFVGQSITNVSLPNVTNLRSGTLNNASETLSDKLFGDCSEMVSFYVPKATRVSDGILANNIKLESVNLRSLIDTGSGLCENCQSLKGIVLPSVNVVYSSAFNSCYNLEYADILGGNYVGNYSFLNCRKLTKLIIRKTGGVCSMNISNVFNNTPLTGYGGLTADMYVPSALISSYQSATNWSTILSNGYTTIHAIEGSIYETQYADGTPIE